MSDGIWAAVSGAVGQVRSLEVAANNLANAGTVGFRADRALFREYLSRAQAGRQPAKGLRQVVLDDTVADGQRGAFVQTGRPLDVAIKGRGWLVVQSDRGERYTRDGGIQIASDGTVGIRDGSPLLSESRTPIRVPTGTKEVRIGAEGTVNADGTVVGRLLTVEFAQGTTFANDGAQLVRPEGNVSAPRPVEPQLEPGSLEQSTASVVSGMIDIVACSRAFEACQKAVESFGEIDRRAVQLMDVK